MTNQNNKDNNKTCTILANLTNLTIVLQMNSTQYNSSRTSKNLFRQRSISSLPSRQMSVMNIIHERESVILTEQRRKQQQQSIMLTRENQMSKLRKNLETAVSTAIQEKLENSKNKQEIVSNSHHKLYLENKIKLLERQLKKERESVLVGKQQITDLDQQKSRLNQRCKQLEQLVQHKNKELQNKKVLYDEIEKYKFMLKDLQPLKSRIITLQDQVRFQKIKKKEAQDSLKVRQKEKQELAKQLAKTKPKEQQLRERISYFQRVTLDLQRKMEDFNRRQNDYIKQITNLRTNLTRMTADRNHFKTSFQQTTEKLLKKTEDYDKLFIDFNFKLQDIKQLNIQLQDERKIVISLKTDMQGNVQFYKQQGQQNELLKKKNKMLQQVQFQLRRVIEGYVKVSDQVNLTIVARCEQIKTLKTMLDAYKAQLDQTEQKFQKFDKLIEQGSEKGYNAIRQGFYTLMRSTNDYIIQLKQTKATFNQKFMILGQERDILNRNKMIRSVQPPSDQNQMLSIFQQKTQCLVLLQNSNDQLLKVKKDLQNHIQELNLELQKQRKEVMLLKLKTAQIFRTKKQLQQARKKMDRYQQMIQQQNETTADLQSQMGVLRSKNSELNQKHFMMQLEKRNLQVKLKEINEVIKELDIEVLEASKKINEKNAHMITDSIQKLESAIKSLAFFFNCAFCSELPLTPVTLALCGHNYCAKCKQAYSESCYECDTGQPIQKVFQNRFLKEAGGKYKFLTMVLSQLRANFIKKD